MKLKCHRADLAGAVSTVERAVAGREITPSLTGIHLDAKGDRLHFAATDLELGIACSIGADIQAEGDIILDARYFGQIVRRLPGEEVSLEILEDGRARVGAGRVEYTVRTIRGAEFPGVPEMAGTAWMRLPEAALRAMIRQTAYAAASDASRAFLTGVLMEAEEQRARFVATDSNRLALREAALEGPPAREGKAIVPARALQELLRILQEREDLVEIALWDNQAGFQVGTTRLVTRLIEGQFPNYQHVIPQENDVAVTIDRLTFIDALERAGLLAKRGPAVATLSVEDGLLRIQAREADVGQVTEELDVKQEGKPVENAYQVRFLLEALKAMEADEVTLNMNAGDRQAMLTAADDPGFLYILMPVRLS